MRTAYSLALTLFATTALQCAEQTQYVPWSTNHDQLAPSVDALALQSSPGAQRLAPLYESSTREEDGHVDWNVPLQVGQCYLFVGVGWNGVHHMSLYLWDPREQRVGTEKPEQPSVRLRYCPAQTGQFHLQAKTAEGFGPIAVGVYADAAGGAPPPPPSEVLIPEGSVPPPPVMMAPGVPPPPAVVMPPGMAPPPPPPVYVPSY